MADQNPKAPTAPATVPETKEEKKPKEKRQEIFESPEAALKEANERTKGPRRAFTVTHQGKTVHTVSNNEGRALGAALALWGGTVTELGEKAKKVKPIGVDAIMAAVNALPEAERGAVLKQLEELKKAKKAA